MDEFTRLGQVLLVKLAMPTKDSTKNPRKPSRGGTTNNIAGSAKNAQTARKVTNLLGTAGNVITTATSGLILYSILKDILAQHRAQKQYEEFRKRQLSQYEMLKTRDTEDSYGYGKTASLKTEEVIGESTGVSSALDPLTSYLMTH